MYIYVAITCSYVVFVTLHARGSFPTGFPHLQRIGQSVDDLARCVLVLGWGPGPLTFQLHLTVPKNCLVMSLSGLALLPVNYCAQS